MQYSGTGHLLQWPRSLCIFEHPFPIELLPRSVEGFLHSQVPRCWIWMTHLQNPHLLFSTLYFSNFITVLLLVHHFHSPHYDSAFFLTDHFIFLSHPLGYLYWLPLLPAITYLIDYSRILSSQTHSSWLSSLILHLQLISFEEMPITPYIAVAPSYRSGHF